MVAEHILTGVHRFLQAVDEQGIRVSFAVLFGSQAAGTATSTSDIDLIVVSPTFDGERRRADVHQLWRTAARIDSRIEPIPCGERQWIEDDSSILIETARREGVRIDLS